MKEKIKKIISQAISDLQKDGSWPAFQIPEISVDYAKDEKFGDYATNIAMVLARSVGKNPLEIAEDIKNRISETKDDYLDKVEVASPGYLNFFLSPGYFHGLVSEISERDSRFGENRRGEDQKVLLEFVSCNPTGPIHLGNGRGGPLGDILANVLEKSGYQVTREFYINDFGNQIEILGHSILGDDQAQYRGDYIDELARERNKDLTDPMEIGNWAAGVILERFIKPTCDNSGIRFDNWFSEKSLHESGEIEKIIGLIREWGLYYEKEGAFWYQSTDFGDDKDRVLKKTDGKFTYLVVDFAYHKNKLERGFDKLINIMGADHFKETEVVKNFTERILEAPGKIDYILTQMVRVIREGKEVRMSKRKGVYFALDDLIEEVGKDAVRFIFASYSSNSQMNFDIDLAKEKSEKNPVFYVQYAYARISNILKKAQEEGVDFEEADLKNIREEKELSLLRELDKFPELVEEIARSYEVHKLPYYAIRVADKFHSFYNDFRVVDKENPELTKARLKLVNAVRIVLGETLRLIGVKAPERM